MFEKQRYNAYAYAVWDKKRLPQCGCSFAQVLSKAEIRERYCDTPNVELESGECMLKYAEEMKAACFEWDKECRMHDGFTRFKTVS